MASSLIADARRVDDRRSPAAPVRVALLAALAVAAVACALWPSVGYSIDDPYIVFHNARSLVAGGDPLYGTSPLVGSTSLIHLLLVAMLGQAIDDPNAALVISLIASAAYAAGLWRWGWCATAIGLLAGTVPLQLFNGLETALALAAIVWAIHWADERRLGLLAGVMPFIRPELGLLALLLLARQWWRTRDFRPIVWCGLVAAPFAAFCLVETGAMLPNTAAAKIAFAGPKGGLWAGYAIEARLALKASMLPLLLAAPLLLRSGLGRWLLAFLALWLTISALTFPTGFYGHDGRYWAVAVPIIVYGLQGMAAHLLLVITLLTAPATFLRRDDHGDPWPVMVEAARRLPPGSTVLIHDAGWIAYGRPALRLIDVVGLKSPRSTEWHRRFESRDEQWGRALDAIARESRADYLIALDRPLWRCIPANMVGMGWRLTPVFSDPKGFVIYRLAPPDTPRAVPVRVPC